MAPLPPEPAKPQKPFRPLAWMGANAKGLQTLAALVGAATAVAALLFANGQITEMRRQTQIAQATGLWLEYANWGMERPALAVPPAGPVDPRLKEMPRYYIYMTLFMWAADESLELESYGERWRESIEFQLGLNRAYFCGNWNQFRYARPRLERLVEDWRSSNCRAATPRAAQSG